MSQAPPTVTPFFLPPSSQQLSDNLDSLRLDDAWWGDEGLLFNHGVVRTLGQVVSASSRGGQLAQCLQGMAGEGLQRVLSDLRQWMQWKRPAALWEEDVEQR